jgi:chromosome segregation ATPase
MGYRDDRAALKHQIKVLEQELAPMREELGELDEQRESLRQELASRGRTLRLRRISGKLKLIFPKTARTLVRWKIERAFF